MHRAEFLMEGRTEFESLDLISRDFKSLVVHDINNLIKNLQIMKIPKMYSKIKFYKIPLFMIKIIIWLLYTRLSGATRAFLIYLDIQKAKTMNGVNLWNANQSRPSEE